MPISLTQIFLTLFLVFALSRVYLRYKDGTVTQFGLLFWLVVFGSALVVILYPNLTTNLAQALGIGRGADVIIYTSITLLFYLVFRLYVYMQDIKHDITEIVKKLALKDEKKDASKIP